jgi:hypothetical protein
LSEKLSGAYAPQTRSLFQNVKKGFAKFDICERPHGTRVDKDLEVPVDPACGDVETHSVLHGAVVGRMAGRWIAARVPISQLGTWPAIRCDDTGG